MGASAQWMARRREIEEGLPLKGAALVCEVNDRLRLRLSENLRAMGYRVHDSASGVLAAFVATQMRFKIALISIALPDMNGLSLIRHVRDWERDALIIALSPHAENGLPVLDELAHYAGADHAIEPNAPHTVLAEAIASGRVGRDFSSPSAHAGSAF